MAHNLEKYRLETQTSSKWSFLCSNEFLRRVVRAKILNSKISYRKLGVLARVPHVSVHDYITKRKRKPLTDFQLIKICDILGITVDIKIDITDATRHRNN